MERAEEDGSHLANRLLPDSGLNELAVRDDSYAVMKPPKIDVRSLEELPRTEKEVDAGLGNFSITKAQSFSHNKDLIQMKQKRAKVVQSIDTRYVAEHYYKGLSDESLMFEKDGVISRML